MCLVFTAKTGGRNSAGPHFWRGNLYSTEPSLSPRVITCLRGGWPTLQA